MSDIYKTGVYRILNLITGDFYIGSASRIHNWKCYSGFNARFQRHKNYLKTGKHHSIILQRSWNKYGEENFEFEILALCPPKECINLEQQYIDNLKPKYNIRKYANSNLGLKFTTLHKEKMSIGMKEAAKRNLKKRRLEDIRIKLNEEKVKNIKQMLLQGLSLGNCAKKYNVGRSTIQNIKQGWSWSDITI